MKAIFNESAASSALTDEPFEIPQSFSLERYWKSSESGFKEEKREAEDYPVTVRLKKCDAELLKRFDVYETRYAEDFVIAVVNMHKFDMLGTSLWILSGRLRS